jgi:hypothetical protein
VGVSRPEPTSNGVRSTTWRRTHRRDEGVVSVAHGLGDPRLEGVRVEPARLDLGAQLVGGHHQRGEVRAGVPAHHRLADRLLHEP